MTRGPAWWMTEIHRKAVDFVCLDFRKAFVTTSNSTPLEKLAAHGLDYFRLLETLNAAGCQLINT